MKFEDVLNPSNTYENGPQFMSQLKRYIKSIPAPFLRWIALRGFPIDSNSRKLAGMKDSHKGRRGFVIGNGPSLRMDDLSRLTGEVTIASNKIYLAFDKTSWRPTYYSIIDSLVAKNIVDEVAKLSMPMFFPKYAEVGSVNENVMFCSLLKDWFSSSHFEPGFSDDLIAGIYAGESVTYWNIQILWYLGIREIYLVGVDHSFTLPSTIKSDNGTNDFLVCEGEKNHFDERYRPVNEVWTMPHLDEQAASYEFARVFIEKNGGIIKNASRQTKLTCLDVVDFDSLF